MPLRGIEVDGRNADELLVTDKCACGTIYGMEIKLRKQCHDCEMKWLYPPDGVKPKPKYSKWDLIFNSIMSAFAFVMCMIFIVRLLENPAHKLPDVIWMMFLTVVAVWLPWGLSAERKR